MPFLHQTGNRTVFQAIPVSIVTTGGSRGIRAIQLPQQPLSVFHTLQPTATSVPQNHFRPETTTSTVATSGNVQLPVMASNISSFMPKFAATAVATHQRAFVQQQPNEIYLRATNTSIPPLSTSTTTSSSTAKVSSSFILAENVSTTSSSTTASNNLENELSYPPDELFNSVDGEASSTATTVSSENLATSAIKSLPSLSSSTMNNINDNNGILEDEDGDDESSSPMNVFFETGNLVTSSSLSVPQSSDQSETFVQRNNISSSLNLPSNPPRGLLQEIPRGWLRKLVSTAKGPRVFYYNTMGKKFSTSEDVNQFFLRLGQLVKPGLFNFEPDKFQEDSAKEMAMPGKAGICQQQQPIMQSVLT